MPVDVAYVTTLSQQEVPDYFAGPAMAKTITQESRVVFGPEQEEWKAAILAELESFAKWGVCATVKLSEVGGAETLPGRLVLVVKPNPAGAEGKKKARIVVCGNFQTVSLASYKGWPIETWCVDGIPLCKAVWRQGHRSRRSTHSYETAKSHWETGPASGRDTLEVEESVIWLAYIPVGLGSGDNGKLVAAGMDLTLRRAIRVCGQWFDWMLRMVSHPRRAKKGWILSPLAPLVVFDRLR